MDAGRRGGPVLSAHTLNSRGSRASWPLLLVVPGTLLTPTALAQPRPGQEHRPRHLTAPSSRDALEIGADYLREHVPGMGLADDDLDELQVMDRFVTRQTGMTHLHLRQHVHGIEVEGAGRGHGGRCGRAHARAARRGWCADSAVACARAGPASTPSKPFWLRPGISTSRPRALQPGGRGCRVRPAPRFMPPPGISHDDIPVKLVYVVDDFGSLQLCWNVVIRTPDGRHWWNLYVDAVRGEVLRRNDWIAPRHLPRPSPAASESG